VSAARERLELEYLAYLGRVHVRNERTGSDARPVTFAAWIVDDAHSPQWRARADVRAVVLELELEAMTGHVHGRRTFGVVDLGNGPECSFVFCEHPALEAD
jgi:hypothetical protein